jgi:hypothetical protein
VKNNSKTKERKMTTSKAEKGLVLKAYDPQTGWLTQGITMEDLAEVLKGLRKALTEAGFTPEETSATLISWFQAQNFFALPK